MRIIKMDVELSLSESQRTKPREASLQHDSNVYTKRSTCSHSIGSIFRNCSLLQRKRQGDSHLKIGPFQ